MDSARFIAFLRQLRRDAGGPILVAVGNAKYNHSKETRRFVEEHEGQIQLVYLPPYSPELNPDEQVWNHAKREIGKRTILNKTMLERVVLGVIRLLQKKKDLVCSFFQLPGMRYILDAINLRAGVFARINTDMRAPAQGLMRRAKYFSKTTNR